MVIGAAEAIKSHSIDYIFISTHSNLLHYKIMANLGVWGYRIEVSSDFENETTSFDGLIFASSPKVKPLLAGFKPLQRSEIAHTSTIDLVKYIKYISGHQNSY